MKSFFRWIRELFRSGNRSQQTGKPQPPAHPSNQMDGPGDVQGNTTKDKAFFERYALELTGAFEGSGYDQVTGDFDGQGLSLGILQWCIGQGSLQNSILKPYFRDHEPTNHIEQKLAEIANVGISQGLKLSRAYFGGGKGNPKYINGIREFIVKARPYQIAAAKSNFDRAWAYANQYNMKSLKAFCWFFDITVQNGSLKGISKPNPSKYEWEKFIKAEGGINKSRWLALQAVNDETAILCEWTNLRANKNKWRPDVISRKCTIAHGFGMVHGKLYDFREDFKKYQGVE